MTPLFYLYFECSLRSNIFRATAIGRKDVKVGVMVMGVCHYIVTRIGKVNGGFMVMGKFEGLWLWSES